MAAALISSVSGVLLFLASKWIDRNKDRVIAAATSRRDLLAEVDKLVERVEKLEDERQELQEKLHEAREEILTLKAAAFDKTQK